MKKIEHDRASSSGFALEDLVAEQVKDPDLEVLLKWLKTEEEPTQKILYLRSNASKAYWLNREAFELIDGVLYVLGEDEDKKFVLPKGLKEEALRLDYDIPSAAHQGIDRTKARIKEKIYLHTLSMDVKNFVRSCEPCTRNKKAERYWKCPFTEFQAGSPMERVHIDFRGSCLKPQEATNTY